MNIDMSPLLEDLAAFADLGTEPPHLMSDKGRLVVGMFRGGEKIEIEIRDNGAGQVIERFPDGGGMQPRPHASYRALLASEMFGDLRLWADHQRKFLRETLKGTENPIPVTGVLSNTDNELDIGGLDDHLVQHRFDDRQHVQIMLIDGPAGIGKTRLIESLALARANEFLTKQRPLILHVQSRGRVLTFLQDLIAFSLQRLRLSVTFDQVPVLVRHGLVTLVIDGFDELGDPNGYDFAWSQVNELVTQVRGRGTLILAGRDTFIGRERIRNDIKSLEENDHVEALSLQLIEPCIAKRWLRDRGWSGEDLRSADVLFEAGSYALRPFFLTQLADRKIVSTIRDRAAGNPLAFLVEVMIEREAGKFGNAIENVMDIEQRRGFVRRLLREVARHMADDQTEAIDEVVISWLVEFATPEDIVQEALAILRNRAAVMAFLENDDAPRYRRFAHSQLRDHFLGEVTIDAISDGEIPKFIRRNVLGADFLSAFSDLALHLAGSDPERIQKFFQAASESARTYLNVDRGSRNLGALLVTILPAMEDTSNLRIEKLNIDESLIQGTAPEAEITEVTVNQFDIRGADLRALKLKRSTIWTLIVNDMTRVPHSFPDPSMIQNESFDARHSMVIRDPQSIRKWLDGHGRGKTLVSQPHSGLIPNELRDSEMVKLIGRACRSRSYWIPMEREEDRGHRFVRDPHWTSVLELLREHDLVREERLHSSGRGNMFIHIKRSMAILREDSNDPQIRRFYESLVEKIHEGV